MVRTRRSRSIELARGAWGAALLFMPCAVLDRVHDVTVDRRSVVVVRILGARQLTQAALSGFRPSPEVLAMGVWVDAVHAVTAFGLAISDRDRTPGGLIDTAIAGAWARAGYRDLVAAAPAVPSQDRRRDRLARLVLRSAPGGDVLLRRMADGGGRAG